MPKKDFLIEKPLCLEIISTCFNNLMKLGGSLGNVPQKLKKLLIKT
jgi:hypothetical protein